MSFVYVRNLLLYFVMCKYSHITKLHLGFPGLFEVKCLEVVTIFSAIDPYHFSVIFSLFLI